MRGGLPISPAWLRGPFEMTDASSERPEGLAAYIAVTAAYWAFMLTDGALRMLVLLHFNTLGFSPVQLAYLFLLYEFMGVVTNLCARLDRRAVRSDLDAFNAGLALQVIALVALAQLDPAWAIPISVAFVMIVQGVSGVAKDLAKMSSKSAVKVLAPKGDGSLFRWVAILTGSKNAVKGTGVPAGSGAPDAVQLRGRGLGHGRRSGGDPDRRTALHAGRAAAGQEGHEIRRGLFQGPQREPALRRAALSVRRARHLVCRRHPDLFLLGPERWQPGGANARPSS